VRFGRSHLGMRTPRCVAVSVVRPRSPQVRPWSPHAHVRTRAHDGVAYRRAARSHLGMRTPRCVAVPVVRLWSPHAHVRTRAHDGVAYRRAARSHLGMRTPRCVAVPVVRPRSPQVLPRSPHAHVRTRAHDGVAYRRAARSHLGMRTPRCVAVSVVRPRSPQVRPRSPHAHVRTRAHDGVAHRRAARSHLGMRTPRCVAVPVVRLWSPHARQPSPQVRPWSPHAHVRTRAHDGVAHRRAARSHLGMRTPRWLGRHCTTADHGTSNSPARWPCLQFDNAIDNDIICLWLELTKSLPRCGVMQKVCASATFARYATSILAHPDKQTAATASTRHLGRATLGSTSRTTGV